MSMRVFVLAVVAFCGLAVATLAQDATFEATVDKNPVAQGDQFTLSLVLSNAGMGGGKNLQLPDLGNFHVMAGPNQSTSMQIVNGQISSSVTYSYVLQPKDVGKFTIGAASIEAGGKRLSTRPITLEVVKGTPRQQQQQRQPGVSGDIASQIGDNVFLKATVDKSSVMQGEQINLAFKLYTRLQISNYSIAKNPTIAGFWGEDIENPRNISLTTEVIDGKQYSVGVLKRMALFPTQSGQLEISPMEVKTTVQVQTRRSFDLFDSFFRDPFGQSVEYMVKSDPVRVKVQPLPPGAPADFKGAVGRFSMKTSVDKERTKANEPVSLKVSISGTGNIRLLESPELELPGDFERYPPKVAENISREGNRMSGSKTFEHLLIPRYPGEKRIRPITFTYFDLGKKEYVTLRSPELTMTVEPGDTPIAPMAVGGAREDVRLLSQDIRFIKVADGRLARRGDYLHTSTGFVVLTLLPLLGLVGAFVYARQRQVALADEVGYRNRRALRVARRGLRKAEQLMKESTKSGKVTPAMSIEFHSEVAKAIWGYLGGRLAIPQADLSIDRAVEAINGAGTNGELSAALKSLLETCEMIRFAPTSHNIATMRKTYSEASNLIVNLEKVLKKR